MRRPRQRTGGRRAAAASAMLVGLVIGCTGGSETSPPPSVVTTTTTPAPAQVDDGVLRLGAMIPAGDPDLSAFLSGSIERAVDEINQAGGVLGNDVDVIVDDEGDSPASAAQAIENLAGLGVDAIIGPTSSNTAIGALDGAVAEGIVMCSATATAIALDAYPDDDLFFRTIATDTLQAIAIAGQAQATGASTVAIVHVDDAYGRPYANAVAVALGDSIDARQISIAVDAENLDDKLDELRSTRPEALVVVASGDDTARFLEALGERPDVDVPDIFLNDDARSAPGRQSIATLPEELRNRIQVIAPQIVVRGGSEVGEDNPPFAPQITDCINLLALSAVQGQSDSPPVIASQMVSVSDGGVPCGDFQSCSDTLAAGDDIDYDGPTGLTSLGRNGDPSRAFFDRFALAGDGTDDLLGEFAEEI